MMICQKNMSVAMRKPVYKKKRNKRIPLYIHDT